MLNFERNVNSLMIIVLCGVLTSAFGVQFILHEEPCPLCMLQRLGMIGVATGALFNLVFGIHTSHYAFALLSSLTGGFVALRQISLHVCPGTPVFGLPVLGLSLYTWSFIVFACCVLGVAVLLFLYEPRDSQSPPEKLNWLAKFAIGYLTLITAMNVATTFMQCGFGPCEG